MPPASRLPMALAAAALLSACGGGDGALRFHGTVEIQQIRVGSKQGGRVAETLAAEGDLLEAGSPIARFETPELEARRAEARAALDGAAADLARARNGPRAEERAAARAALEAARAHLALLRSGARAEEIAAARAELEAADADAVYAEEDLARNERLLAERTVSRNERDQARAARDRARGRQAAAKARLDLLLAGSRAEDVERAAAEARRLEANLALLEAGTRPEEIAAEEARVAAARARLAGIEADLAEALVLSPGRAVLEVLAVRRGDLVAPGAPVARLHAAADLWVKVYVPETMLGLVALGRKAAVSVDSFPGRTFPGVVTWIAAQAEFTPRNVQSADERRHQVFGVKVRVEDPQGVFKSGMAADVVLEEAAAR